MKHKIVILGAGESGTGAAILAQNKGLDVFVSDSGKIQEKYKQILLNYQIYFEEKQHCEIQILSAQEVIKSPGISEKTSIIKKLKEKRIPIISEIEFAARYTHAKMLCITGSNGKTTTSLMLYHMMKKAGLNVGLGGNVGKSLAWQVAKENFDYYVVELSSFQLDGMFQFKANVAILLNITPDHLDRYDYQMQNYVDSKFKITQNLNENDVFVYCADDEILKKEVELRSLKSKCFPFSVKKQIKQGAWIEKEQLIIDCNKSNMSMNVKNLSLKGMHNLYNAMATGIVGSVLQIEKDVIRESLQDFRAVNHRLEELPTLQGIRFINDSKATNVNSTWYALDSIKQTVVWIVGGVDKGNDYSILFDLVKQKVKAMICLGTNNEKIHAAFNDKVKIIVDANSMSKAVKQACKIAQKGEVVLLSPACASFDLFTSYEDRGNQFKNEVKML